MSVVLKKIFGSNNQRQIKKLMPLVNQINQLESEMESLSDEQLVAKTAHFRERLDNGESTDSLMSEAFSVVREASKRTLGMRHFDVQMLGGIVLHQGKIAEMKTGEGKTLCATLPVYLNALTRCGVHVVTVNDYLAKRDAEWMGMIYSFLGLSTGVVVNSMDHESRLKAYSADITYGQNNEFGFDYLRDNMKVDLKERVQNKHHFAIVDEVDSILIDEARTPLIISGPTDDNTQKYLFMDQVVRKLTEEEHFTVDIKAKQVALTDVGVEKIEQLLKIDNLYDPQNIELVHHANNALSAHVIRRRDVDYVVANGQVVIVDEFTGRQMPGRRWSDGLHQAIEAKEGVKIANESQTLASITFQNYFRMYEKLAGMTGTADTEAVEFQKIYGLDVVVVPTNRPMARKDHPDVVYANELAKYKAAVEEIEDCYKRGQPVLVGTANIDRSEYLSELLIKRNVEHTILNAKHHKSEAEIVSQAGRKGAVTISTNMAGRGTDIVLGGNPKFLVAEEIDEECDPESEEYKKLFKECELRCEQQKQAVLEAGGLHVLGTERHESRRIDNQLRGRSGRQGDPGSSRFYVSLEDELMQRFGGEKMKQIMSTFGFSGDDAIEGALVAKSIANAQKKVEGRNFDIRKHLLEYDDVMNRQREVIYDLREKILSSNGLQEDIYNDIGEVIESIILSRANDKEPVLEWNVDGMFDSYGKQFGIDLQKRDVLDEDMEANKELAQVAYDRMLELAKEGYENKRAEVGHEQMSHLERLLMLQNIDYYWKEHLAALDHLKEGVSLRGYGQRNPLHEYQREAFNLFTSLMLNIKSSFLQQVFMIRPVSEQQMQALEERERQKQREEEQRAKAVHEAAESSERASKDSSLNRRQRRRVEKGGGKVSEHVLAAESVGKKKKRAGQRRRK